MRKINKQSPEYNAGYKQGKRDQAVKSDWQNTTITNLRKIITNKDISIQLLKNREKVFGTWFRKMIWLIILTSLIVNIYFAYNLYI